MREKLLSDFITNQYNIQKLEVVVRTFLNLIDTALLILANENYDIKLTQNYDMRVTGTQYVTPNSRVESFLISKYDTDDKLKELLSKYLKAFNNMSLMERELFARIYIKKEKKCVVMSEMHLYQYQYDPVKRSAIVKFCLVLGLDKYVDKI